MRAWLLAGVALLPASAWATGGWGVSGGAGVTSAQQAQINGAVQAAGGNASATNNIPSSPNALPRTLAAQRGDLPSALDYGVKGGGTVTANLQAQASGSTTALLPNLAADTVGELLTSPYLPIGTTIKTVGASASTTATQTTSAALPARTFANIGTGLTFGSAFAVPVGATISGTGVPSGATVALCVVNGSTTTVYMSAPTTAGVASGASISFGWTQVPVTLTGAGWTQAVTTGSAVGLTAQDDALTFQNATFFVNVHNGGRGLLYIPTGSYYASTTSGPSDGASVQAGPDVVLLPGSQPIGGIRGTSSGTAATTIASAAQNSLSSGLNVNQTIFQQATPTNQTQGLLVNQHNINCVDDGGPLGCGMVGTELQQDMDPSITYGIMWGYHATDYIYSGQSGMSWVGSELEINDNSGTDKPLPGGTVVTYGTHYDLLGSTNGTAGIYFGASGAGRWHYGMACPQNAISNYCWSVNSGVASTVLAGVDMSGNLTGASINIAGQVAGATGSFSGNLTAGTLTSNGFFNSQGISNTLAPVLLSDTTATDPQPGTARAVKISGNGLAWINGAYGDSLKLTSTFNAAGSLSGITYGATGAYLGRSVAASEGDVVGVGGLNIYGATPSSSTTALGLSISSAGAVNAPVSLATGGNLNLQTTQSIVLNSNAAAASVTYMYETAANLIQIYNASLAITGGITSSGIIANSVGKGLTAAGTTLATALALVAQDSFVTTVASGSGVALPNAPVGARISITNRGANTLNIWPFSATDQIEATTAGTAATLATGSTAVFERDVALHWYRVQ